MWFEKPRAKKPQRLMFPAIQSVSKAKSKQSIRPETSDSSKTVTSTVPVPIPKAFNIPISRLRSTTAISGWTVVRVRSHFQIFGLDDFRDSRMTKKIGRFHARSEGRTIVRPERDLVTIGFRLRGEA